MGAAALAGRLPRGPARRATPAAAEAALAFHEAGGPLLAVCGLVGGAGASTLAYLLARRAARHSSAPVLLAELQDGAGLTALTQTRGLVGLRELAYAIAHEQPIAQPYAELQGGLRLVACAHPTAHPTAERPAPASALARVLSDARAAHGLAVVDAGPPGPERGPLLDTASHVLFVLPATETALRRAELLAAGGIFTPAAGAYTALVAVATCPGPSAQIKQLRRLAERHVDRLLLVPHVPELAAGQHHQADARLEDAFGALATLLRRRR